MTRFSVVVPAYNAERTIGQTICSILRQSVEDLELIVVDDGSSDGTPDLVADLAARDSRIRLIRQGNQGTAAARNTGISHAGSLYVSFLDNDDLWLPTYLETMGAALDSAPDAAFAYCDAWSFIDETLQVRRRTELELRPPPGPGSSREEILVTLAKRNFVMSSATIRLSALEASGRFAADVTGTDDYELWFRLLLEGGTAVRAGNEPLMLQRDRRDSQSKDETFMLSGLARVLKRASEDSRMPAEARAVLRARVREADEGLAQGRRPSLRTLRSVIHVRGVRAADRLLPRRTYLARPPDPVAAAFPEFARAAQGRRRSRR